LGLTNVGAALDIAARKAYIKETVTAVISAIAGGGEEEE